MHSGPYNVQLLLIVTSWKATCSQAAV